MTKQVYCLKCRRRIDGNNFCTTKKCEFAGEVVFREDATIAEVIREAVEKTRTLTQVPDLEVMHVVAEWDGNSPNVSAWRLDTAAELLQMFEDRGWQIVKARRTESTGEEAVLEAAAEAITSGE